MDDKERLAFESWAVNDDPKVVSQLVRDEDGEYVSNVIAACWDAWQASALRTTRQHVAYLTETEAALEEEEKLPVAWMNEAGDIQKQRELGYDWPLYAGDAQC